MRARERVRAETCAMIPAIVAALPGDLRREAGGCLVTRSAVTETGCGVIVLAPEGGPARLVVKAPATAHACAAQRRETAVLAELHAESRLGDWRRLLPVARATGTVAGRPYRVDAALPGEPMGGGPRLLEAASECVGALHRATATAVEGDEALLRAWVDAPAQAIAEAAHRRERERLEALRRELRAALAGRTLPASWIHGDFWPGNLLVSSGAVTGVVDWDAAAPRELPLHDVLHLLLYSRRLASGHELGSIVARLLRDAGWASTERRVLARAVGDGTIGERHALLLYWLRFAAYNLRQMAGAPLARRMAWRVRNVHAVLAAA